MHYKIGKWYKKNPEMDKDQFRDEPEMILITNRVPCERFGSNCSICDNCKGEVEAVGFNWPRCLYTYIIHKGEVIGDVVPAYVSVVEQ